MKYIGIRCVCIHVVLVDIFLCVCVRDSVFSVFFVKISVFFISYFIRFHKPPPRHYFSEGSTLDLLSKYKKNYSF